MPNLPDWAVVGNKVVPTTANSRRIFEWFAGLDPLHPREPAFAHIFQINELSISMLVCTEEGATMGGP